MDTTTLYLIEDDQRLAELTSEYLTKHGFQVTHINRGDSAVPAIIEAQPDLVILDLMLPGLDGLDVFRQIKPEFDGPVLMLTAKDEDIDHVLGLELGADDYVIKPVQPRLLLARIHALLRRVKTPDELEQADHITESDTLLAFDSLRINLASREVRLADHLIDLTTNEFDLLCFLAQNAGEILYRDRILSTVRGIEYDGLDRWVDIRVSRLRQKLGDDAEHPQRIKTVWGKGYLFVKDAWRGDTHYTE